MKSAAYILIILLFPFYHLNAQNDEGNHTKNRKDTTKRTILRPPKPMYLEVDEETVIDWFNRQPSFTMYHDNYFVTGIPTNKTINKHTADAKYQVSISQRLTKAVLPFNTFLMLIYTQKSFWDIYESSSPFLDNNYNPGILLGKPLIKNNQLRGMAYFSFEHESNGKSNPDSRSWNNFILSTVYFFDMNFSIQGKIWAGWASDKNPGLYKYRGYGLLALNYRTSNDTFWFSTVIQPRGKWGRFNTQLEINWKLNPQANQYLFLQWYNGYGESLLEYNKFTSMVRVGICIKPQFRNLY